MGARIGLEWAHNPSGSEPQWALKPSIRDITNLVDNHLHLGAAQAAQRTVHFDGQDALNKEYTISCPLGDFKMRLTLPVDPRFKTLSETATIEFLRQKTSISIPLVMAFDSSSDKLPWFEWILTEQIPGRPLRDAWGQMSWPSKEFCVVQVADIMAQLFRLKFRCIGNHFRLQDVCNARTETEKRSRPIDFIIDRIVSMPFFWDTHFMQDVHRGPFASGRDWMMARLTLTMNDCKRVLQNQARLDDTKDAEAIQKLVQRLLYYLPKFFAANTEAGEQCVLCLDNVSQGDIRVSHRGKVTGVVNWGCVSVLPLWKACQVPSFLSKGDRLCDPDITLYQISGKRLKDTLYSQHKMEYEIRQLRLLFLDCMESSEPQWMLEHSKSVAKIDFELAVESCSNAKCLTTVKEWLDRLDSGVKYVSLQETMK